MLATVAFIVSFLINPPSCHPERSLARSLRQTKSKDLRLHFAPCNSIQRSGLPRPIHFANYNKSQMPTIKTKPSKNSITIDHLSLACRHFHELCDAGMTVNMSIRTLELFADVYAKVHSGGSANPHHVSQVALWSIEAKRIRDRIFDAQPRLYFRVEHGTPRREFALRVLRLHDSGKLTKRTMATLVKKSWRLAVITIEEDSSLNKVARSKAFDTPEARWAAAKIKF
jgi:hypothetical protein